VSRDDHYAEVEVAIAAVAELQEVISMLSNRQEQTMGAVIMAVGSNPNVESAQNSMSFIQEISNRADEMMRITQAAIEELRRYGGGF
jgi:uncharacterized protein (UPF0333 family)